MKILLFFVSLVVATFSWKAFASCSKVFSDLNSQLEDSKSWTIVLGNFHNKNLSEKSLPRNAGTKEIDSNRAVFVIQDHTSLGSKDVNTVLNNISRIKERIGGQSNPNDRFFVLHTGSKDFLSLPIDSGVSQPKSVLERIRNTVFFRQSSSQDPELQKAFTKDFFEISDERILQQLGHFSQRMDVEQIDMVLPTGHPSSMSSLVKLLSWIHPKISKSKTKISLKLSLDLQDGQNQFGELSTLVLLFGNELKQLYPNLKIELFDANTGLALKSDVESIEKVKVKLVEAMVKAKLKDRSGNLSEVEKYFEAYIRDLLDNLVADYAETRREIRAVDVALSNVSLAKLHKDNPLDKLLAQALANDAQFLPESFEVIASRIGADPVLLSQDMERFREESVEFEKELIKKSGMIYRKLMVQIRQEIRQTNRF